MSTPKIKADLQYICNYLLPWYKLYKIKDKHFIQLRNAGIDYVLGPAVLHNFKLYQYIYRACALNKQRDI